MKKIVNAGNSCTSQKLIVGTRQLSKALKNGHVKRVYLAKNADPALTKPIAQSCMEHNIQPIWVSTMLDLGRECGIDVGAAAAAVVE